MRGQAVFIFGLTGVIQNQPFMKTLRFFCLLALLQFPLFLSCADETVPADYFVEPANLPYNEEVQAEKQETDWHWKEFRYTSLVYQGVPIRIHAIYAAPDDPDNGVRNCVWLCIETNEGVRGWGHGMSAGNPHAPDRSVARHLANGGRVRASANQTRPRRDHHGQVACKVSLPARSRTQLPDFGSSSPHPTRKMSRSRFVSGSQPSAVTTPASSRNRNVLRGGS